MKRRVAILISGRGSNMAALIDAAKAPDFPAEIVAVISNRADAGGLEKAAASGIPTEVIESKPFGKDRAAFEAAVQRALEEKNVELICLAGFMRLFTAEFVQRWYGKMLNIHPSLLPSFPGIVRRRRRSGWRENFRRDCAFRGPSSRIRGWKTRFCDFFASLSI